MGSFSLQSLTMQVEVPDASLFMSEPPAADIPAQLELSGEDSRVEVAPPEAGLFVPVGGTGRTPQMPPPKKAGRKGNATLGLVPRPARTFFQRFLKSPCYSQTLPRNRGSLKSSTVRLSIMSGLRCRSTSTQALTRLRCTPCPPPPVV